MKNEIIKQNENCQNPNEIIFRLNQFIAMNIDALEMGIYWDFDASIELCNLISIARSKRFKVRNIEIKDIDKNLISKFDELTYLYSEIHKLMKKRKSLHQEEYYAKQKLKKQEQLLFYELAKQYYKLAFPPNTHLIQKNKELLLEPQIEFFFESNG